MLIFRPFQFPFVRSRLDRVLGAELFSVLQSELLYERVSKDQFWLDSTAPHSLLKWFSFEMRLHSLHGHCCFAWLFKCARINVTCYIMLHITFNFHHDISNLINVRQKVLNMVPMWASIKKYVWIVIIVNQPLTIESCPYLEQRFP